ncbi:TPA: hypothetical protein ACP61Y_004771 [Escherichia coli]
MTGKYPVRPGKMKCIRVVRQAESGHTEWRKNLALLCPAAIWWTP